MITKRNNYFEPKNNKGNSCMRCNTAKQQLDRQLYSGEELMLHKYG